MKSNFIILLASLLAANIATVKAVHAKETSARYIIVHNDMPITIYPVVESPENGNCNPGSTSVNRIILPGGVPSQQTIKIYLPGKCWYNAGRVFIFTPNIEAFETRIDSTQKTQKGPAAICYEVNSDKTDGTAVNCYKGSAAASYPLDSPAQLTEYTFDADDPATGKKSPDPDTGKLMTDIDISYVDETFLPVAMAIDNGGEAGYMGTTLSYAEFSKRIDRFLELAGWSSFAAYTNENWQNNVFYDLISFSHHIMGGYNLLNSVNSKALSGLYKTTSATYAPYLIEKLSINQKQQPSNPSVAALVSRWKQWLAPNLPCANGKAPANPALDQTGFCQDFQATVQWVWDQYKEFKAKNPYYCQFIGGDSKPYEIDETACLVEHIMGYTEGPDGGQLPESVQALLRSVPWNDEKSGKPLYQYNKWLLFWAPFDSLYNLNPFSGLIHHPQEGFNAAAYSFSIDDKYGNFRDQGTGLIINVGGDSYLPNKTIYDPYQQYFVTWPAHSFDHATVCGKEVRINKLAGNSWVSMWQNGKKQEACDIALYLSADADSAHLNFELQEENKRSVIDSYTGKTHEVQGLTMDVSYCREKSSPSLAMYCDQANLSPVFKGDIAYVSLKDEEKPKTTLNVAAIVTGTRLNLAPGWISATGCGLPAGALHINPDNGSSFPLASGTASSSCTITLTGKAGQQALLNLTFKAEDEIDPASVSCIKINRVACAGVYVDANNINLPPPDAI